MAACEHHNRIVSQAGNPAFRRDHTKSTLETGQVGCWELLTAQPCHAGDTQLVCLTVKRQQSDHFLDWAAVRWTQSDDSSATKGMTTISTRRKTVGSSPCRGPCRGGRAQLGLAYYLALTYGASRYCRTGVRLGPVVQRHQSIPLGRSLAGPARTAPSAGATVALWTIQRRWPNVATLPEERCRLGATTHLTHRPAHREEGTGPLVRGTAQPAPVSATIRFCEIWIWDSRDQARGVPD